MNDLPLPSRRSSTSGTSEVVLAVDLPTLVALAGATTA